MKGGSLDCSGIHGDLGIGTHMPWTVRLENEDGIPTDESFLVIEFGSLPTGSAFPISSLIEAARYYDTLLNPVQTKAFIAELNAARTHPSTENSFLLGLAVKALEPHTYLRFIGD
jgi:hypothetical protein